MVAEWGDISISPLSLNDVIGEFRSLHFLPLLEILNEKRETRLSRRSLLEVLYYICMYGKYVSERETGRILYRHVPATPAVFSFPPFRIAEVTKGVVFGHTDPEME